MALLNELSTGTEVRLACRQGDWTAHTAGLAAEFAQANVVILPSDYATDFRLFCERNPQPCPLLEVTQPGDTVLNVMADDADIRTDLPRYRVWSDGEVTDEPTDITDIWRDDLVSFLIGCSFTFDASLMHAGLHVRHVEDKCNVPMYRTNMVCQSAGQFQGPLVVSMRPFSAGDAARADELTSRFPHFHGRPIHQGDPQAIGIDDLSHPDFGDAVALHEGEIPVFWACGVTPQCALESARLPFAITHAPGHMLVTDRKNDELL